MAKYKIESPIKFKGKRLTEGTVELDDDQAAGLIAAKAVSPLAAPAAVKSDKGGKAKGNTE